MSDAKVSKNLELNCNELEYIFFKVCFQEPVFLLIKTSVSVAILSDSQLIMQNIRFLQRDGCFCLTNKFLQVFNNQFVCLVNGRCVNRGEIYLCGGYGIMPERVRDDIDRYIL